MHRLLAVEEQQFDREGQLAARLDDARQLDQRRGARRAVARADEAQVAEQLRVEVAGEDDAIGALGRGWSR